MVLTLATPIRSRQLINTMEVTNGEVIRLQYTSETLHVYRGQVVRPVRSFTGRMLLVHVDCGLDLQIRFGPVPVFSTAVLGCINFSLSPIFRRTLLFPFRNSGTGSVCEN